MVIIRFMIDTQMTRIAIRFEQEKYFWGDAFLSSLSKDLKKRISGHERIFRTKFEKHQILVSILFRLSYSLTACKRIGEYRERLKAYHGGIIKELCLRVKCLYPEYEAVVLSSNMIHHGLASIRVITDTQMTRIAIRFKYVSFLNQI